MTTTFTLESFGKTKPHQTTVFLRQDSLERIKKDSFQAGYTQGYNNASQEVGAEKTKAMLALTMSLEDFSFTSIEARQAVLASLSPLIFKMVEVVLPCAFKEGLAEIVAAQIKTLAANMTDGPIAVKCAAQNLSIIEALTREFRDGNASFTIVATVDPNCGSDEIWLSSPAGERHIDLNIAIEAIQLAVSNFFNMASEDHTYG
jgi:flagellar assembly protein FliH